MYVHVYVVFIAGKLETLDKIKELIKLEFNIQDSKKVKKFLRAYYEWVHDEKGPHEKRKWRKT